MDVGYKRMVLSFLAYNHDMSLNILSESRLDRRVVTSYIKSQKCLLTDRKENVSIENNAERESDGLFVAQCVFSRAGITGNSTVKTGHHIRESNRLYLRTPICEYTIRPRESG